MHLVGVVNKHKLDNAYKYSNNLIQPNEQLTVGIIVWIEISVLYEILQMVRTYLKMITAQLSMSRP